MALIYDALNTYKIIFRHIYFTLILSEHKLTYHNPKKKYMLSYYITNKVQYDNSTQLTSDLAITVFIMSA